MYGGKGYGNVGNKTNAKAFRETRKGSFEEGHLQYKGIPKVVVRADLN